MKKKSYLSKIKLVSRQEIRTRPGLRLRMLLAFRNVSITLGFITIPLFIGNFIQSEKIIAVNKRIAGSADRTVTQVEINSPSEIISVHNSTAKSKHHSVALRLGYVDLTNTGIMYISSGTLMASEGSVITSATGNTENNGNLYVKGDWINNGTYTKDNGKVTFWDVDAQVIDGTSGTVFYNAEINKSPGTVTLNLNTEVSNTLTLTAGMLDLNSKTLTISSPSTSGISYTNGSILSERTDNSSKVQWNIGSTAGAHIIPFGTASGTIIPLTLDQTAGVIGNVTVSTYPTVPTNIPFPVNPDPVLQLNDASGFPNSANVVDRFWQINKTGASGTLTITFTYANAEAPSTGEATMVAQRYNTSNNYWAAPVPSQTADISNNTVTAPGISSFGPFTLSKNSNVLPIELLSFSVKLNDQNQVDLKWVTASEINNSFFTIQRSKNSGDVEEIENIPGAGTTTQSHYYSAVDKTPYPGDSYYRLKQTDYDGKFTLSEWKYILAGETKSIEELTVLNIFPNPFTDEFKVEYELTGEGEVIMQLVNMNGQLMNSENLIATAGKNIYTYSNSKELLSGVYYFNIIYNGTVKSFKLVKQK